MSKTPCEKPFRARDDPADDHPEAIAAEEFCLVAKNGNVRAVLCLDIESGPGLHLYDPAGELRASFCLTRWDDVPNLALIDKDGRRRTVGSRESDVEPVLVLLDKDGEVSDMLGGEYEEGSA